MCVLCFNVLVYHLCKCVAHVRNIEPNECICKCDKESLMLLSRGVCVPVIMENIYFDRKCVSLLCLKDLVISFQLESCVVANVLVLIDRE